MERLPKPNTRRGAQRKQRGQALIYGLFVMVAASTAAYFMVFAGNLANEKTKLVNTADAVAYSAGVMHARALNFDATINRAMVANEAIIAQLVSISSWATYTREHAISAGQLNCTGTVYSVPVVLGLVRYTPVCYVASYSRAAAAQFQTATEFTTQSVAGLTAVAQTSLQIAGATMLASLSVGGARASLMQEVADANYTRDGEVHVDLFPLQDEFLYFKGDGPLIRLRSGDERNRFRDVALEAAYKDEFVKGRQWSSASPWPCAALPRGKFKRRGGTELMGLDEWRALDTSSLHFEHFSRLRCRSGGEVPLGYGSQSATPHTPRSDGNFGGAYENPKAAAMVGSKRWGYSGIPRFFELSSAALEFNPQNSDTEKRELTAAFTIRLTRSTQQVKIPEGTSVAKPSGKLDAFPVASPGAVLAAVSTSEIYFERPTQAQRADGMIELASLFNPYWQTRLRSTPASKLAFARTLQGLQK